MSDFQVVQRVDDGQGDAQPNGGPPGIDVHELANRVYKLFLADARLGRARTELGNIDVVGGLRREE
jgi:hypothetical protein